MKVLFEWGDQGPEGAVIPYIDGQMVLCFISRLYVEFGQNTQNISTVFGKVTNMQTR